MTTLADIRDATGSLTSALQTYTKSNNDRLDQIERKSGFGPGAPDMTTFVSNVKTAMQRPLRSQSVKLFDHAGHEHKQAFLRYVTKGIDQDLAGYQSKAMSVVSDPDGGYLVPAELSDRIVSRQFDTTPMRQLANVMTISSDAVEMLRDTDEADAQWVSELQSRPDTEQGQLGRIRIPVHELYAQPRATQKLLDDATLNVEDWLVSKISDRFTRKENAAFVNGDGVGQPRGFVSYPTAATSDGSRAWGVIEHVKTGADGAFASANPADTLIELVYKLKAGYLPGAAWLMPRAIAEQIRKFKENTTNAYIWQPGLAAGQPPTLFGYPLYLAEDMPGLAAGSLSVAFGNFREAYTIVDRSGVRLLRDPYTAAPFVKFRADKRVGGDVTNFDAIKLLKFAA
jgi:HK97 family phage major capsid protein